MQTLYITDLDGTLLNNQEKVSEKTVSMLNAMIEEKGILFSIASARSFMTAEPILKNLKLRTPIVLMNGVFVYDLEQHKAIRYFEMEKSALQKAFAIYEKHNKSPFFFLYGDDDLLSIFYTDLKLQIHKTFYERRKESFAGRFRSVQKLYVPKHQHPVYFSLVDKYEDLKPMYDEIMQIEGLTASFYSDTYSEYWYMEVYSDKASKANGAMFIKDYVNADRIAAFGDNLNDLLLFSVADEKYAVSNAVEALKVKADKIILSNEENGVAEYLKSVMYP